jgi:hypothetical protein
MQEYEQPITSNIFEPPIKKDPKYEEPISNKNVSPLIPLKLDNSSYADLDSIFREYDRDLTKEDILGDERLMEVIRSNLEARYTPGGVYTRARRTAVGLGGGDVGGIFGKDYRSMDDERVFEIWQNYQRSFAGGQTVTTANEIAYGMGADDNTKIKLGAGYKLFDQMGNAFTGEGSWSEMGDAIWDYTKSAVYDPSTILGFGIGKALTFGVAKTKGAVARALMIKSYQDALKKGVTKTTALKAIGESVKKAVPFAVGDASIAAGVDVGYQMQLIDVGVQDEYSKAQTGLTALGAMTVIPTLVALGATAREFRKSDLAPQWLSYTKFNGDSLRLGSDEAERLLKERVQENLLIDNIDENFGVIKDKKDIWKISDQVFSSAETSINQKKFPTGYSTIKNKGFIKDGDVVLDIGGGRFDNVLEDISNINAKGYIFDPFNRPKSYNDQTVNIVKDGGADVVMSNNVLNVIKEDENIIKIIEQAENALKINKKAFFSVYSGNATGVGKETSKGFQRNEKLSAYVSKIENIFGKGNVEIKNNLIIATKKTQKEDTITPTTKNFLGWNKLVDASEGRIKQRGERYTDSEVLNAFFTYFFRGDPTKDTGGYAEALKKAGFVVHESMIEKYGNKTAVYANAINFLSDDKVKSIVKKFEKDTGYKLKFFGEGGKLVGSDKVTAKSLESHLVKQTRQAGVSLQIISNLEKFKKEGYNTDDAIKLLGAIRDAEASGITIGSKVSPIDNRGNIGTIQSIEGDSATVLFINKKTLAEQTKTFKLKDLRYVYSKGEKNVISKIFGYGLKKEDPRRGQFIMSTYKRLLTSHLSTTGANVKGFTALVSLNTAADFATGAINLGQSGLYKVFMADDKAATKYFNRFKGSYAGAFRRGTDIISPDVPIGYADAVLELNPEIQSRLFRDVAGDGGVRDSIETFNLDRTVTPERMLWRTADSVTKGAQTLSLVRLQDDLTKRWAFGTNVNQAIMREYGISPDKFFSKKDVGLEMASDRFKEMVLEKALFRTQRETASVNWSTLPGREGLYAARTWAKNVEIFSNRTPFGFIVPFGSFLNTTVATMADLTAVNAFRFGIRKLTGDELDFATREGAEAVGKAIAGWSTIYLGIQSGDFISEYFEGEGGGARDRIKNGLAYNQDQLPDGSISDRKYDWPVSTMRLLSQIGAHGMGDSNNPSDFKLEEVPTDLIAELGVQIGAQSVRDLDRFGQSIIYASKALIDKDTGPFLDLVFGMGDRIVQGATRPFDPINQIIGIATDKNMNPNLKEGAGLQGQMMRYVNNIFGDTEGLSKKATATRGVDYKPDVGKQILGNRGLPNPNLVESMMNMAGQPYWEAIGRIDAPEKIRNILKGIAAPIIEATSIKYLKLNPDYKDLPLKDKEKILDTIRKESRSQMMEVFEKGMPKSMNIFRLLDKKNKKEIKNVMNFLGLEGELEDVMKEENPLPTLLKIQTLMDIYDDVFYGDLKLD